MVEFIPFILFYFFCAAARPIQSLPCVQVLICLVNRPDPPITTTLVGVRPQRRPLVSFFELTSRVASDQAQYSPCVCAYPPMHPAPTQPAQPPAHVHAQPSIAHAQPSYAPTQPHAQPAQPSVTHAQPSYAPTQPSISCSTPSTSLTVL